MDLGLVGDVEAVNAAPLRVLDAHGLTPVIAPIATGRDGATYNINGDHAAGAIAASLGAAALIQMTDVPGILDNDSHVVPIISRRGLDRLIPGEVMLTRVVPVVPYLSLAAALRLFDDYAVNVLPVLDTGNLMGALFRSDLVRQLFC